MKVIKIGGGSLRGKKNILDILDLVAERGRGNIIVVSAFGGITDMLIEGMSRALEDDDAIPPLSPRSKTSTFSWPGTSFLRASITSATHAIWRPFEPTRTPLLRLKFYRRNHPKND
jgi:aspartokinase